MVTVMRPPGSPEELEHRRRLAVRRLQEGYTPQEIADFLEVDPSSVRRWDAAFRQQGALGLSASPAPGRPRKLSHTQEKIVLRWLADLSTEHTARPSPESTPRPSPAVAGPCGCDAVILDQ